jgi:polyhydroxyalkanoate synthesis repressor PhaR
MSRVIKKYPNRRLYDTDKSRYIKLADIRDLVMGDVDFVVYDKKTGTDITRSILLQVISEQELQGDAILSEAFLAQVIKAHGTGTPDFLARHLEKSLTSFIAQKNQILDQVKQAVSGEIASPIDQQHKKAG